MAGEDSMNQRRDAYPASVLAELCTESKTMLTILAAKFGWFKNLILLIFTQKVYKTTLCSEIV